MPYSYSYVLVCVQAYDYTCANMSTDSVATTDLNGT